MKKLYSFVLMAMMLLIGTNASAKELTGNTGGDLRDAIYAIMSGAESDSEIKLTQDVIVDTTIWVGTVNLNDPYKSITLDLNGRNITWTNNDSKITQPEMFVLTHGELIVKNSSTTESEIKLDGTYVGNNSRIFIVYGTFRSSRWNNDGTALEGTAINTRVQGWFSHLVIGTNVKLQGGTGCPIEGIACDALASKKKFRKNADEVVQLTYKTTMLGGGFAHGVRIDVYGKIDIPGSDDNGKKTYGISVKGNVQSPISVNTTVNADFNDTLYAKNYKDYNDELAVATDGITHKLDSIDAPFIWVHPGAEISVCHTGTQNKVAALYSAGYSKWLVQGYVVGKTGMYVSSGTLDLVDAYVKSDADSWQQPNGLGSANGGGSGVVINSRTSYPGDVDFVVSGDTKIESVEGYAIEEAVNTTKTPNPAHDPDDPSYDPTAPEFLQETKVSNITIEGGTIVGGDEGAIAISVVTKNAADNTEETSVVVAGGTVEGLSHLGDATPSNDLSSIMPESGYHQTEVEVDGKTVMVISQGNPPATDGGSETTTWAFIKGKAAEAAAAEQAAPSYKWTEPEADAEIANGETVVLGELQALSGTKVGGVDKPQILTINDGGILMVNHLMLNDSAQIIVKAGGKLIIAGTQGIVAPVYKNIKLESSENAQAIFLFHPNVTSNRHPNATVQLTSKGYRKANGQKVWQRFGVPSYTSKVEEGAVIRYSTDPEDNPVTYNYAGWIDVYDYSIDNWKTMPDADAFVPFQCYAASSVATEANQTVYTFKCPLMGNADFTLPINGTWNYYANSYMAPIDIKEMLTDFADNNANLEATVYVYRSADNWWDAVNLGDFSEYFGSTAAQTTIDPMQAFIFRIREGEKDAVVDYGEHIYTPIVNSLSAAPARNREAITAGTAMIEIAAADGAKDKLYLIESDNFSAEYDNGYDAAKYMNESFNLFASVNDEKMAKVATDNLEGTVLGMNTKEQTSFTMTISHVNNINYAIRDNFTGTEIEMVEGATYMFSTAANANIEGRFEIVPVAKMPTTIENIEATAAAKGIYTITGQFVGNDYHILPNGIYVVDGKKIVK